MLTLGIDTSGENLGLALANSSGLIGSYLQNPDLKHGEIIQNEIEHFLKMQKLGFLDLQGLSVTLGPGSFTGLRIGLAAAKGICYARKIPLTGISTMQAIADLLKSVYDKIVIIVDARRDELYIAAYERQNKALSVVIPDMLIGLNSLREYITDSTVIVSSQSLKPWLDDNHDFAEFVSYDDFNLAESAALKGAGPLAKGETLDLNTAVPNYVRRGF